MIRTHITSWTCCHFLQYHNLNLICFHQNPFQNLKLNDFYTIQCMSFLIDVEFLLIQLSERGLEPWTFGFFGKRSDLSGHRIEHRNLLSNLFAKFLRKPFCIFFKFQTRTRKKFHFIPKCNLNITLSIFNKMHRFAEAQFFPIVLHNTLAQTSMIMHQGSDTFNPS